MAIQPEVRYINQYVSGTMAYQPERKPSRKYTATLPKPRKKKQEMILVDPVAVVGIAVAVVLMVALLVGAVQLYGTLQETVNLRNYVALLQEENAQLRNTYAAGYDLEEIRDIAQTMGMIPKASAPHLQIQVTVPEAPVQPSAWESFWQFFMEMFA